MRLSRFLACALLLGIAGVACGGRPQAATMPAPAHAGKRPASASGSTAAQAAAASTAEPPVTEPVKEIELEPMRIEVVGRTSEGEPDLVAFDARMLLDEGNAAMAEERYDDAIARYRKLLEIFPDSRLVPAALFNIGIVYEARDDYDAAMDQYRTLAKDASLERESIDAHLRIGALEAELKRWSQSAATLQEVLMRNNLTHSDRIEALARLGYVLLEQKDYASAEARLREALEYYKSLTTRLETNYFVAMSHYYLAQIPHRQFSAIPMRLPDEQLRKDLDAKAALVMLAYDRYVEALKVQNVYWATAAGYQMSQIYKEFWDEIVLAPIPPALSPEARSIYQEEVHRRVQNFLERALTGHTKNVELAQAFQTSTVWSDASRVRAQQIAEILAKESGGELVVPVREERPPGEPFLPVPEGDEYMPGRIDL